MAHRLDRRWAAHHHDSHCEGWTLSELMVVLAIVGILAALSIPHHLQQQRQNRRIDGRAALQQLLLDQVSYRGKHGGFATQASDLGWPSPVSSRGHYRLQIMEATPAGFSAEAWPVGGQAHDTACSPLRLVWEDSATVRYSSGPRLDSDPERCWGS